MNNSKFKRKRQEKGYTQKSLAEKSDINERRIQKIESGEIRLDNMTGATLQRLAKALETTIEELLL